MMADYRLTNFPTTNILREADGAIIPFDLGNVDYIAYLAWVAAGNTPDPVVPAPINQAAQLAAIQAFRVKKLAAAGQTLQALAAQAGFTIKS